jgi:hypothetical protein
MIKLQYANEAELSWVANIQYGAEEFRISRVYI